MLKLPQVKQVLHISWPVYKQHHECGWAVTTTEQKAFPLTPVVMVTQAGRLFAIMSARLQVESELLAGLREVILPQHKDVGIALFWDKTITGVYVLL